MQARTRSRAVFLQDSGSGLALLVPDTYAEECEPGSLSYNAESRVNNVPVERNGGAMNVKLPARPVQRPFILVLCACSSVLLVGTLLAVHSLIGLSIQRLLSAQKHVRANIQHYEYIFPDGWMDVYDMDHHQALVKSVRLPTTKGVRGAIAHAATGMLYISYGSDGPGGTGYLLKYNLVTNHIVWTVSYPHPVDTIGISPDGKTLYQAGGEKNPLGIWYILDAATGRETGNITSSAASGPHNTIVSLNGSHLYMGGLQAEYLVVADTASRRVIQRIGPLMHGAGRPFTINGRETLVFTTGLRSFGFQVSDIHTGRVLYTVPIHGFPHSCATCSYNHGISLSPNEKELYLIDWPDSFVHVFDVSLLPGLPPEQIADIPLTHMTGNEDPCVINCEREGWLQHSVDGRFVYVGDAGDVIDTATRKVVAYLPALTNTRKFLEIDWQNGFPLFASQTKGVGYKT
jgi:DNA-binding beta-propeller fold protein YncE